MSRKTAIVLILILSLSFLFAKSPYREKDEITRYKHTISMDPIVLLLGALNFSYEYRLTQNIALEGMIATGNLSFVKITNMNGIYFRYYKSQDYTNNEYFLQTGIQHVGLKDVQTDQKEELQSIYIGGGKRWLKSNNFFLEFGIGVSLSQDDKFSFKDSGRELVGGGPVRFGMSFKLGIYI